MRVERERDREHDHHKRSDCRVVQMEREACKRGKEFVQEKERKNLRDGWVDGWTMKTDTVYTIRRKEEKVKKEYNSRPYYTLFLSSFHRRLVGPP